MSNIKKSVAVVLVLVVIVSTAFVTYMIASKKAPENPIVVADTLGDLAICSHTVGAYVSTTWSPFPEFDPAAQCHSGTRWDWVICKECSTPYRHNTGISETKVHEKITDYYDDGTPRGFHCDCGYYSWRMFSDPVS